MPAQAATAIKTEDDVLQIIRKHPEVILESLQTYNEQQQEQQAKARQQVAEKIKNSPSSFIEGSPTSGKIDQKVVLVEFSDFQCPFCAEAHKTVDRFMKTHQDQVAVVYKHFPLTEIHSEAISAAKASWAANQQGKFWQFHDALFAQQDKLGDQLYLEVARNLGLDVERFNKDRQDAAADLAIKQDIELAEKLGVRGTPFFVINGRVFEGAIPLSVMEGAL